MNGLFLKMKMHSNFRWGARYPSGRGQILCAGLICATALVVAGCGKQSQSPAPSASTPQDVNASQPAAATPTPAASSEPAPAATTTNALPDLRPLNSALIDWRMQNRRVPSSFAEFAASANINIPPPPPGKKYVINSHGLISLVEAN